MKNSFVVKCIAIILFAAFMTTLLLSGAGIVFGIGLDAFAPSEQEQAQYREEFIEELLYNYEWRISDNYEAYVQLGVEKGETFKDYAPFLSKNILYKIKDENGDVVYSTIDDSAGNA